MPVVVLEKRAKGCKGDIWEVHKIYTSKKDIVPFKNSREDVQHQCIASCKACYTMLPKGHICNITCRHCCLDKLPNYELEDRSLTTLKAMKVNVYLWAQNSVQQFDIEYIRPSK